VEADAGVEIVLACDLGEQRVEGVLVIASEHAHDCRRSDFTRPGMPQRGRGHAQLRLAFERGPGIRPAEDVVELPGQDRSHAVVSDWLGVLRPS